MEEMTMDANLSAHATQTNAWLRMAELHTPSEAATRVNYQKMFHVKPISWET